MTLIGEKISMVGNDSITNLSGISYLRRMCGESPECLSDRQIILKMQSEAPSTAIKYTAVILTWYVLGMAILWLHFVKQKYGQVSKIGKCQNIY